MKLSLHYNPNISEQVYTLRFSDADLIRARFSAEDFALLHECSNSESVADRLLGLELIARRIEEAEKPNRTTSTDESP